MKLIPVPGLIKREIISSDEETVTIRETWDPRVPGCPLVFFDKTIWPWRVRTDVEFAQHTYTRPRSADFDREWGLTI